MFFTSNFDHPTLQGQIHGNSKTRGQAPALYYVVPTGLAFCEKFTGHQQMKKGIAVSRETCNPHSIIPNQ